MRVLHGRLLLLVLLVLSVPGCEAESSGDRPSAIPGQPRGGTLGGEVFSFAVIADTQTPGGPYATVKSPEYSPVFHKMIRQINLTSPDLVIDVGDLVEGHCGREFLIRQWDAFDEAIKAFHSPVYMVVGNHDIWSKTSEEIYTKRYGPAYYSFNHKGAHFTVLSTEVPSVAGRIDPAQLEWLEKDLAAHAGYRSKYVFLHQPLWAYGSDTPNVVPRERQEGMYELWMRTVHPLLKKHEVDVVFSGHWHQYLALEIDGIRYVTGGGGGGNLGHYKVPPEVLGRFYHYLIVTVRDGETNIAVVKPDGIGPEHMVTLDTWRTAEKLVSNLFPSRIEIARGADKLPGTVTCKATNPFDEAVTGELRLSMPTGSPWEISPQKVLISIPAKTDMQNTFQITYKGQPGDEGIDRFQARCLLSLKVGEKVLWHETERSLKADTWPYKEKKDVLSKNQAAPRVEFNNKISENVAIKQKNPFEKSLKQTFLWDLPEGRRWKISPARKEFTLGPGEEGEVVFKVEFAGPLEDALPLPRLQAVAVLDDEEVSRNAAVLSVRTQEFCLANAREAICGRVLSEPVIDGVLDEEVWRQGTLNSAFMPHFGHELREDQTEFRVCYDDKNMYFGIRFFGGEGKAKVTETDDDNIWVDDGIEIFLDTNRDRKTYYHFIINANGVHYDALVEDTKWNSGLKAATSREKGSWTMEVAIPRSAFEGVEFETGTRLGLNLVRDWPSVQSYSHSQWSPTFGSNHVPDRFGILVVP